MALSNTYTNLSQQSYQLIQESFERIGIAGELMEEQKFDAALRSLNFMFQQWMGLGINLWSLKTGFVGLNAGQSTYKLSDYLGGNNYVKDVNQAMVRTSQRQNIGGVPFTNVTFSGGHGADQAFTNIPYSYCQLTQANGQIGYTYISSDGTKTFPQVITMVGIQGNTSVNNTYLLNVYGIDSGGNSFKLLQINSQTYGINAQGIGIIYWFPLPSPASYISYYIQEMTAASQNVFLNIQNIFFNTQVSDTQISPISRSEYLSIPNKAQQSRPSSYYFDRQVDPVLSLWPAPSSQYNCLMISYEQMLQDVTTALDNLEAPALYNEAIIWGLAYRMACKYVPDKIGLAKQMADEAFSLVSINNSATTPIMITPDWTQR